MILTASEKRRIAEIRKSLRRVKRQGVDVSTWESTLFLKIIDRVLAQIEFKKVAGL